MRKRLTALALGVGLMLFAAAAQQTPSTFEIVPGERFGPIRETTTRAEMVRMFDGPAVVDRPVQIGEGMCTAGTVIFSGQPNEAEIGWQDNARTRVAFVRASKPGDWKTRRGVRVGMSLRELEKLAGRILTFNGFGWDYGGGMSWTEDSGSLALELDPDPATMTDAIRETRDIFGDREVRSDHPAIRQLTITVHWMRQSWGSYLAASFCG